MLVWCAAGHTVLLSKRPLEENREYLSMKPDLRLSEGPILTIIAAQYSDHTGLTTIQHAK